MLRLIALPFKPVIVAIIGLLVAVAGNGGRAASAERIVDLELVLAVDVSGSMDADEHRLQRQGYVSAFRHPGVLDAIKSGFLGRIAVTYFEWAGPRSQVITVPWTVIHNAKSADAFADILATRPIAVIRGTSISGGLLYGLTLFNGNGFSASRRVIDISGDGANNRGEPVVMARDFVVGHGITINGLPLMLKEYWGDGTDLDTYYRDCVIGGPSAFVIAVNQQNQMARAIRRKLVLEIAGRRNPLVPARLSLVRGPTDCLVGEKQRLQRDFE